MNLRLPRPLLQKLSPERLAVLVVVLGLSFGAVVLVPGVKLASELVETSAALKWVGEQQRYTTVIRLAGNDAGSLDRPRVHSRVARSAE